MLRSRLALVARHLLLAFGLSLVLAIPVVVAYRVLYPGPVPLTVAAWTGKLEGLGWKNLGRSDQEYRGAVLCEKDFGNAVGLLHLDDQGGTIRRYSFYVVAHKMGYVSIQEECERCLKDMDRVDPFKARVFRCMMGRADKAERVEIEKTPWLEVAAAAEDGASLSVLLSIPNMGVFQTMRFAVEVPGDG